MNIFYLFSQIKKMSTSLYDDYTSSVVLSPPNFSPVQAGEAYTPGCGFAPVWWRRTISNEYIYAYPIEYSSNTLWLSNVDVKYGSNASISGIPANTFFIREKADIQMSIGNNTSQSMVLTYYQVNYNRMDPLGNKLDLTGKVGFRLEGINLVKSTSGYIYAEIAEVRVIIRAPMLGIGVFIDSGYRNVDIGSSTLNLPFSTFTTHPLYNPANVNAVEVYFKITRRIESNIIIPLNLLFSFDKFTSY